MGADYYFSPRRPCKTTGVKRVYPISGFMKGGILLSLLSGVDGGGGSAAGAFVNKSFLPISVLLWRRQKITFKVVELHSVII